MSWYLDGVEIKLPCTIKRVSQMKPSEISGMLLTKGYFADVLGQFLSYEMQIAVPFGMIDDYTWLYEKLTEPVDGHTFVMPYNSTTVTISGRVESINDVYVRLTNSVTHWKGITFTVISNAPTKTLTLAQVQARGMNPLPDITSVDVGQLAEYTTDGWELVYYTDADEVYY